MAQRHARAFEEAWSRNMARALALDKADRIKERALAAVASASSECDLTPAKDGERDQAQSP